MIIHNALYPLINSDTINSKVQATDYVHSSISAPEQKRDDVELTISETYWNPKHKEQNNNQNSESGHKKQHFQEPKESAAETDAVVLDISDDTFIEDVLSDAFHAFKSNSNANSEVVIALLK